MSSFIICSFIAFCVSSVSMPFVVLLSKRLGAISEIGGRHVGQVPIGRLGGVGALMGVVVAIGYQINFDSVISEAFHQREFQSIGLSIGVAIVGVIGFLDDIFRLSARLKFVAQMVAAFVAYLFGLRISGIAIPFYGSIDLGLFGLPVTMLWIVGIVNAVNLIDGLDGLAGGVLLFASLVNLTAAVVSGSVVSAALMASIGGAVLGFLLYNWHPAKVYLGDGGAYSLGFILAVSGLLAPVQKASTGVALLIPILALGVPIIDTSLTMFRRFLNKRGMFSPDRGHLHHILLDAGISHRRVVFGLYAICCVLCSLALLIVLRRNKEIGYYLVAASVIGSVFWGVSVREQLRQAMLKIVDYSHQSSPVDTKEK